MIRICLLSILLVFHFGMYFLAMSQLIGILDGSGYGVLAKNLITCTSVVIGLMLPVCFLAMGRNK